MMKKWYVIQVYAGYEEQVAADLKKHIEQEGMQAVFGDVLVPSAKVKAFLSSQEVQDQRLFPGYVLVEMEPSPETIRLVKSIPRVLKFLGGNEPVSISKKEIEKIMATVKGEVPVVAQKKEFLEGTEIEIATGPFDGFVGIIERVDQSAEKLTVMVSIFGRLTPVEIGFDQVKR